MRKSRTPSRIANCKWPRRRTIVEQAVASEIVREIDFGKQVAVEVRGRRGERPAAIHLLRQHAFRMLVADRRRIALRRAFPKKEMFAPAVCRLCLSLVHRHRVLPVFVEIPRAVREVIRDEQVGVSVAVEVGLRRGVRVPAFAARGEFLRVEAAPCERAAFLHEEHRRAAPVIDQHIERTVLVEVAEDRPHRRGARGMVRQRRGIEHERRVPLRRARHRRDRDESRCADRRSTRHSATRRRRDRRASPPRRARKSIAKSASGSDARDAPSCAAGRGFREGASR